MSRAFESSSAGGLAPDAVLECGVCWWVYDPARGDEVWDIAPGTPFARLPARFRCPNCDADRSKFMLLSDGKDTTDVALPSMEERVTQLVAAYEKAEDAMMGLPVHNSRLRIEALGFRPYQDGYAGVVVTPWCMNLAYLPADPNADVPGPLGSKRVLAFPSGTYSFIAGRMEGVGTVETCSLFSPMDMFDDPDVAKATAEAAMEGLFAAEKPPEVSRRRLFAGAAG